MDGNAAGRGRLVIPTVGMFSKRLERGRRRRFNLPSRPWPFRLRARYASPTHRTSCKGSQRLERDRSTTERWSRVDVIHGLLVFVGLVVAAWWILARRRFPQVLTILALAAVALAAFAGSSFCGRCSPLSAQQLQT